MKKRILLFALFLFCFGGFFIQILPWMITPLMVRELNAQVKGLDPPEGEFLQNVVYNKRLLGQDYKLDIYYPLKAAEDLYDKYDSDLAPVLIFFHGGSWLHGDKALIRVIDPFLHKLREQGIAVVAVNYTAGLAGGLKKPLENCRDALLWLRDNGESYGLNPRYLGLYGVSAGAHLALMSVPAAVEDPGLNLRFVLEEFGPVDLNAMAGGDAFGSSFIFRLFPARTLEKYSPVKYVDSNWPPLLMFHGTADDTVSIHQTEMLIATLEDKGVPYSFHFVPGGDHGFFNKSQAYWLDLEDRCLDFILPLMFSDN